MTNKALRLKNKKCKLWNKYKLNNTQQDYDLYCVARNELRNLTRSLCQSYENKIASNRKTNVKQFWKYVNSRLKTRPTINALRRNDNSITSSDQEKCELFNNFFQVFLLMRTVRLFQLFSVVPT